MSGSERDGPEDTSLVGRLRLEQREIEDIYADNGFVVVDDAEYGELGSPKLGQELELNDNRGVVVGIARMDSSGLFSMPTLYTIGFTKHTAQAFFEQLRAARVRRLIDVRRNNVSQLAGFAKRDDLAYFAKTILDVSYSEEPLLAPTSELRTAYRVGQLTWEGYAEAYLKQISQNDLRPWFEPERLDGACLLCSEHTAERCHRRLAAEYLARNCSAQVRIVHL